MAVSPTLLFLEARGGEGGRGLMGVTAFRCNGRGTPLTGRPVSATEAARLLDFFMAFLWQKMTSAFLVTGEGDQARQERSRAEGFRDRQIPGAELMTATSQDISFV